MLLPSIQTSESTYSHGEPPPAKRSRESENQDGHHSEDEEVPPDEEAAPDSASCSMSQPEGESNQPAISCPKCGKICRNDAALRGHQKRHSKDRERVNSDWKCDSCNAEFTSAGHYECHNAVAHAPTFRCKRCPATDLSASEIVVHILDHSGFEEARRRVYDGFERKN